jgi:hypothetical protein
LELLLRVLLVLLLLLFDLFPLVLSFLPLNVLYLLPPSPELHLDMQ